LFWIQIIIPIVTPAISGVKSSTTNQDRRYVSCSLSQTVTFVGKTTSDRACKLSKTILSLKRFPICFDHSKQMQPVCRELLELVDGGYLQFVSASYNESDGTYKINLKSSHIHLASRGFKDSIDDVEYNQGKIRIVK
jgi:hypothetical protein